MDEVLEYYEAHGNREERQRANYIMGSIHRDQGNSPMALQYFLQAANLADTTRPDCDFQKLNRIYGQMALIFRQQRHPQKELEMWQYAASAALKAGDTLLYYQSINRKGDAYHLMGDTVNARRISQEAYSNFIKIGRKDYAASEIGVLISYHLQEDSLELAKKELDEYKKESGLYDISTNEAQKNSEFIYYYLGQYYAKTGDLDSAFTFYYKLLKHNNTLLN